MSEQQVYTIRQTPVALITQMSCHDAIEFLRRCPPRIREQVKRAWCKA